MKYDHLRCFITLVLLPFFSLQIFLGLHKKPVFKVTCMASRFDKCLDKLCSLVGTIM